MTLLLKAIAYIKNFGRNLSSFWSPIILGSATLIVAHKVYVVLEDALPNILFCIAFILIGAIVTYPGFSGRSYT